MMKTLAKIEPKRDNTNLSQNHKAVTPNCSNWLFLRLSTAPNGISVGVNPPSINLATGGKCIPFMVWLILQNKPIGEYVERYLCEPRVRPHRPLLGKLLKIHKGVFFMNTKHTPSPTTGTPTITHLQSLAKNCVLVDNTATTNTIAVMPSRHTLAIFTPIMGVIRHLKSYGLSVYGGLIGANTRPKGNSPSRLLAVVETRHPMHGVVSLTKLKGNPTMSEIRYITLNALLDEYHHLTATGEHDRANALYNAYTLLKQVDNSFYTNSTQSIPPSPLVGVLACLCSYLASKGV